MHALNPTAARVWLQCDGQTSPEQIAATLAAELNVPDAEELVWLTLSKLEKAHLLAEEVVRPARRKLLPRREFLRLGIAAAVLPVVQLIVAPTPVEAQSPTPTAMPTATPTSTPTPTPITGSQTFDFTGAEQQFTVPAGVTSVTIQAFGAQGGTTLGGKGGRVTATIPITAGETLFVYVGGQGAGGGSGSSAGGFNGGGAGGSNPIGIPGAGGGGASDVRQGGNSLNNRVIVAGGGGGSHSFGQGGDGGYPIGLPGMVSGTADGGGGTQASGGAGGFGQNGGSNGTAGTLGVGGTGGDATAFTGNPSDDGNGGGGGYYGGGGGGGADGDPSDAAPGGEEAAGRGMSPLQQRTSLPLMGRARAMGR